MKTMSWGNQTMRVLIAFGTAVLMLAFAVPAFANAPNPIAGTTHVVSFSVSPSGARTVSVAGQWEFSQQANCPSSRDGIGYNVAWFDPTDTSNAIGATNSPDGIIYVGSSTDNIVHSLDNLDPGNTDPTMPGVPASYLSHNTSSSAPTSTDVANWKSNCYPMGTNPNYAANVSSGNWGPISHTYPASDTNPITICPVFYDPHGSGNGTDGTLGSSSLKDIIAGGSGNNNDNSYEGNGSGTEGNNCTKFTIPTLNTTASTPGTVGTPITDSATVAGTSGASGSVSWTIYPNTSCTGTGTVVGSEPITGDGTITSPAYTPTSTGTYQWVASYTNSGGTITSACPDASEQSVINKASPSLATDAVSGLTGSPIHDTATLSGGFDPTGSITWTVYSASDTACSTPLATEGPVTVVSGQSAYTSPDYTPANAGTYQWVATYSGDANNVSASTKCNDPNEQSTVTNQPLPAITLTKLERDGSSGSFTHGPITGNVGDTVNYQITIVNTGNQPLVLAFTDTECDSGTLSSPVVLSGGYDASTHTLASGGQIQYTCSHVLSTSDTGGYTNVAAVVGTAPNGTQVSAKDQVVAYANTPGISVLKLQSLSATGPFTTGILTAKVGQTIYYEIQATNTGAEPLTLSISDPRCDAGTLQGPTLLNGTLNGSVLSPAGSAQYTCSHVLTSTDTTPFTNTATVTGTPPSGPPVSGTSSVTVKKAAVLPAHIVRCRAGTVKKVKKTKKGKKVVACVAKKLPRPPKHVSGFTG